MIRDDPTNQGGKVLNVLCWQIYYFLKSITLDPSLYSAGCIFFNVVSQSDQSVTSLHGLLAGEVQSMAICGIEISPAEVR